MTISEKLSRLLRTKQRIREEIIKKGVDVDETEPFSNYAGKISLIENQGTPTVEPQTFFNEKFGYSKNMNLDNLKNCNWAQTDFSSMFRECKGLYSATGIDFKNSPVCTDFSYMFSGCNKLTDIDSFDTSSGTDFSGMFEGCEVLETIPEINTSKGLNFTGMLKNTYHLSDISSLDTSKGQNFTQFLMYSGIKNLPILDFSAATNLTSAFYGSSLKTVPALNTSKVTIFSEAFGSCSALTDIGNLDYSKAVKINGMFSGCTSLKNLPSLNTVVCENFSDVFKNCNALERVESMDVRNANFIYSALGSAPNLRYFVALNLGSRPTHTSFDFSKLTSWGINSETITDAKQSLVDTLITHSYDRAGNNIKYSFTVKLSASTGNALSESEIAQITAKGYTLSVA